MADETEAPPAINYRAFVAPGEDVKTRYQTNYAQFTFIGGYAALESLERLADLATWRIAPLYRRNPLFCTSKREPEWQVIEGTDPHGSIAPEAADEKVAT